MKNRHDLRRCKKLLKKVKRSEKKIKQLSDEKLREMTEVLKGRYAKGESLDSLLPDAFAVMMEADERILKKRPYDVQVLAGIALHLGYMAEMNTGEGKTLTATMPLYLNALTGKSCILVTTNDYLASRDGQEMSEVYRFMGLTCSYPTEESKRLSDEEKKKFYASNIIYTTNGNLGFDYLFDHLVKKKEDHFLCEFSYVIIDEADAVLLDSAVMPLVVSGAPRVQSNLYRVCDFFVTTLVEHVDYEEEDGAVWLTQKGVRYAESFFGIPNFYGKENFEINRHVTLALKAHKVLKNQKDYAVSDGGEVELFDGATGRLMHGVKLRGGQQQAIEEKERLELTKECRTVASITFQNLFMLFDKMAGMSGTILEAKEELWEVYHKKVVRIPTNKPIRRKDRKDLYFLNAKGQFLKAANDLMKIHQTGQPVLAVLNSVADTNLFSRVLLQMNIPHNVLNANNAFWEAQIIAGAGTKGAVTVATTMAGRGTDIKLGEGVMELGGLAVLGIGRMENVRSERQARGRSGRQGDPGFSRFYVSLEDDVVGAAENEKLKCYIEGKKHLSRHRLKKIIRQSQRWKSETDELGRKRALQYDEVLKRQRNYVYETRENLMNGVGLSEEELLQMTGETIRDYFGTKKEWQSDQINRYVLDNLSYSLKNDLTKQTFYGKYDSKKLESKLLSKAKESLRLQKQRLSKKEVFAQFVREATLHAVDEGWVELIDYLEQLKFAMSGRSYAQRNVIFEYETEAYKAYLDMEKEVKKEIVRNILLSDVSVNERGELQIIYP